MRELDATCLVVSAAVHSTWDHFLYAMTPATPVLLTWFGLPSPEKAIFAVGTVPLRTTWGWERFSCGGEWAKLCRILCLSSYVRLCKSGCMCEQQLWRGECLQNFPERERNGAFPGMKFLAPLKLRVQLEHFSLLCPHSLFLSLWFRTPSCLPFLPCL